MNTLRFAALLLCGLGLLFGCSDDKPGAGSGSSAGSGCKSETGEEDADRQNAPETPGDRDEPRDDGENRTEVENPGDTTDLPTEAAGATRGFKESTQTESGSLEGRELQSDSEMAAGRVKVSNLGFSFHVPEGAVAYFATGALAIQVGEKNGSLLTLLIARTGVTQAEARDLVSQPLDLGNGVKLSPQGEIGGSGDRLSRVMSAENVSGFAHLLVGKSAGVGVITVGMPGSEAECKAYSAKVADSIRFAAPGGEKTRLKYESDLKGKQLHVFNYRSGGGGASGASWSSETNKYWHLGSDHSYEYFYKHTGASSFNNPGESGGHASDTDDNHQGSWSIELTLGLPVLVLRDSKGAIHTHVLNLVNGNLHIDGEEAAVGQSSRKQ